MAGKGGPSSGMPSAMWQFRYRNRLTQKEVADFLGITQAHVAQVESGDYRLPRERLDALIANDRGWDVSMLEHARQETLPPDNGRGGPGRWPQPPAPMPMTEGERVSFLVNTLEGGVAARFGEKAGISPSKMSRIKSGELRLTRLYDGILRAYPDVRREWLETGVGYPGDLSVDLVRGRLMKVVEDRDRVILSLTRELDMQRRIIEKGLDGEG